MKVLSTRRVKLSRLNLLKKNPRRGDVERVRESLAKNGQFKPVVVRQSTMDVLAGNHTVMGMRELEWSTGLVTLIECDDATARRIVLADNATSDRATYDTDVLRELLEELEGEYEGSGYHEDEIGDLLGDFDPVPADEQPMLGEPRKVICPHCGHEFPPG